MPPPPAAAWLFPCLGPLVVNALIHTPHLLQAAATSSHGTTSR